MKKLLLLALIAMAGTFNAKSQTVTVINHTSITVDASIEAHGPSPTFCTSTSQWTTDVVSLSSGSSNTFSISSVWSGRTGAPTGTWDFVFANILSNVIPACFTAFPVNPCVAGFNPNSSSTSCGGLTTVTGTWSIISPSNYQVDIN
ncbi:MAG: hypothetical protein H0X33_07305 [Taibaiella sp.]|nr:hypothetical protein [Taibaiella sp.]